MAESDPLVSALGRGEASSDTAQRLADLVASAAAAWPAIDIIPVDFVRYIAERLEGEAGADEAVAAASRLSLSDLYLACACARGDSRALVIFDEQVLSQVAKHIRKLCDADDDVEEVIQILRTRMLLHSGDQKARILAYAGRGPLGAWLRVAGVRAARDLQRGRGHGPDRAGSLDSEDFDEPKAGDPQPADPELAVMKARYGAQFRAALNEVLGSLPDRERNILAMSVLDGLSTDAIGALYRVNGSTVRRWLAQARELVLDGVRDRLRASFNLRATEFDSLMGLVRSELDLNLSQLLRRPG